MAHVLSKLDAMRTSTNYLLAPLLPEIVIAPAFAERMGGWFRRTAIAAVCVGDAT
jgi:hypothetical protein